MTGEMFIEYNIYKDFQWLEIGILFFIRMIGNWNQLTLSDMLYSNISRGDE